MKNSSAESLLSVSDSESQSWLTVSDTESQTSLPLTDTEAQVPPPPYEDTTTPPLQNQITFGDILYWAFQSDWLLFWIILFNTGSAIFRLSQVEDILFLDELTINMIFSHIPLFAYFVLSLLRQNYQLSWLAERLSLWTLLLHLWVFHGMFSLFSTGARENSGRVSFCILHVK